MRVAFFLILSGFVSLSLSAQDQSSVRGTLGGTVVDQMDAVIQGATINLMGPTGGATRTTNEQGEFSFPALIPGFYDVRVTKDGFKGTTVQKIEVLINKTSSIRVVMELGAVTQTIEVISSAVSVESQSTAVTADLSDTVYDNLPLGRSITSVFYVSPGVASGLGSGTMNPAISGGTGLENAYIADGVLLNDASFGGLGVYHRTYGGIGVGINASFVKEVQVNTAAFGPQYGHSTGGVVNMVTKSGGNAFHGTVGGYFQSRGMSARYANNEDFNPVNKLGSFLAPQGYEGDFEFGGYVPLGALKNHLFFFGAFNPTWNDNYVAPAVGSLLFTQTNGEVDRKDTIWDYSAKLTWQLNQNHAIEGSVFGDPTHSNLAPWATLNIDNSTSNSAQTFGSRNVAVRYDGTFGSSLVLDGAFTMNWNNFSESPLSIVEIQDVTQTLGLPGQRGQFRGQGFGTLETYDSNSKGIQFDVKKTKSILGQQHTLSLGYGWQYPTYSDSLGYSGGLSAIPTQNLEGTDLFTGSNAAAVAGQNEEVALQLQLAKPSWNCTLCPYMNVPGYATPQQVVLKQTRGQFSGFNSVNTGKYHSAYINDEWEMSRYATLSLGLRWEQQRMKAGGGVQEVINDQWGPRIGFSVDPKGDRKSKIYANFGRYAWVMPLDAAVRELNAQNEAENFYYAPQTANCSGGMCGAASPSDLVTLNQYNTVTFDPKNILNNVTGGVPKNPTLSLVSTGQLFAPGTRMEYNDEFVVGAEHEFRGGITASVRYIDRRVKRIIEDFQSVSIEQSLAGQSGAYFIGNPGKNTDVATNPNPLVFSQGANFTPTAVPCTAPGKPTGCNAGISYPTGFGAGCYDSNGVLTPYTATNVQTSLQAASSNGGILGSVCYPSINEPSTWSIGNPDCGHGTQPACGTIGNPAFVVDPNALFGGESGSSCPGTALACDGKPDGYPNAIRNYQAIEIEVNKSLSHNWSLISNWRISRLRGNFEGAFRNDNGQNDPGISSLFDFTDGVFGLIGAQLKPGALNADRLHIVNVYPTYVFDKTILKGLVVTPGVKIQSGLPFTTLIAQEPYVNTGEVPVNGRGDLGRGPVTGTVDLHLDYPWRISESKSLHFSVDMMNIANTKRSITIDQFADVTFGIPTLDYQKPGYYPYPFTAAGQALTTGFVEPFSARFHVAFNF